MTDFLTNENQKYYNSDPIKQKEINCYRNMYKNKLKNKFKIDKIESMISKLKIQRCDINLEIEKLNREREKLCQNG